MATRDHVLIRKDFFHCSICLELYESPRSLPCLHSFCDICLYGYIQNLFDKPGMQNLLCPICRADTKTDINKFNSVEKWVKYFPINFDLLSILNDIELKMNTSENVCEPCMREDNKIIATVFCYECSEKLCDECRRHHRKIKFSSSHKLIEIGEKNASSNLKELEYLANISKCPKHCSEEVRYLCQDHDQLCCNECAIVTHRKCENMISLADEVQKKVGKTGIIKRLEAIENGADKLIKNESAFLLGLDTDAKKFKDRLKQFKTEIDVAYSQLENVILSEITKKTLKFTKASSLHSESAEKLKDDVKLSASKVKKTSELGTATHAFLVEKEMEENVKQYEERLNDLQLNLSKTSWIFTESTSNKATAEAIRNSFQLHDETTIQKGEKKAEPSWHSELGKMLEKETSVDSIDDGYYGNNSSWTFNEVNSTMDENETNCSSVQIYGEEVFQKCERPRENAKNEISVDSFDNGYYHNKTFFEASVGNFVDRNYSNKSSWTLNGAKSTMDSKEAECSSAKINDAETFLRKGEKIAESKWHAVPERKLRYKAPQTLCEARVDSFEDRYCDNKSSWTLNEAKSTMDSDCKKAECSNVQIHDEEALQIDEAKLEKNSAPRKENKYRNRPRIQRKF